MGKKEIPLGFPTHNLEPTTIMVFCSLHFIFGNKYRRILIYSIEVITIKYLPALSLLRIKSNCRTNLEQKPDKLKMLLKFAGTWDTRPYTGTVPGKPGRLVTLDRNANAFSG